MSRVLGRVGTGAGSRLSLSLSVTLGRDIGGPSLTRCLCFVSPSPPPQGPTGTGGSQELAALRKSLHAGRRRPPHRGGHLGPLCPHLRRQVRTHHHPREEGGGGKRDISGMFFLSHQHAPQPNSLLYLSTPFPTHRKLAEPEDRRESSLKHQTRCIRISPDNSGTSDESLSLSLPNQPTRTTQGRHIFFHLFPAPGCFPCFWHVFPHLLTPPLPLPV